ncbi:hypothetical protein TL16_g00490 [Triparma laevis f. inornata]|uniref:Uncharacterized protein n=2 Tax=Triparma laevis TaxID=1534972 RepID=A0A9W7KZV5_9STRA|nr:hypothetical protein TL16_g00490 [Triparma laevis f. inornata]GMI18047.1 hypothetical protein TrLO_g4467 [Triparma laevis f. longispina]
MSEPHENSDANGTVVAADWKAKYDELKAKSVLFAKQTSTTIQSLQTSLSSEQSTQACIKQKTKKFVLEQKNIRESLEQQIKTLQEQLSAAEEVATLKSNLKDSTSKTSALQIDNRSKDSEIKRLTSSITSLKKSLQTEKKNIISIDNTLKLKELNYEQAVRSVEEYKKKGSSLTLQLKDSEEIVGELQKRLESLLEDKGERESNLKLDKVEKEKENEELQDRVKSLEKFEDDWKVLSEKCEPLELKVKVLEDELLGLKNVKEDYDKNRRTLQKTQSELKEKESRITDLLSHTSTVEKNLKTITKAKETIEAELRDVRVKAKMVVDRLGKELGELKGEKEGVERKLEEVKGYVQGRDSDRGQLTTLKTNLTTSSNLIKTLQTENSSLKAKFSLDSKELEVHKTKRLNAKSEVQKVVKQLNIIKKDHQSLLEFLDYTVIGRLDSVSKEIQVVLGGVSFCIEMLIKEKGGGGSVKRFEVATRENLRAGVEMVNVSGDNGVVEKMEERLRKVEGGRSRLEEVVEGGGGGCLESILGLMGGGVKEVKNKNRGYGRVGEEGDEEGSFT